MPIRCDCERYELAFRGINFRRFLKPGMIIVYHDDIFIRRESDMSVRLICRKGHPSQVPSSTSRSMAEVIRLCTAITNNAKMPVNVACCGTVGTCRPVITSARLCMLRNISHNMHRAGVCAREYTTEKCNRFFGGPLGLVSTAQRTGTC